MKYKLDATDEKILEKLIEDSSKSLAHISRELGLPRPTVNYRIQRMRKQGIIRKFTIIRDYPKLGQGMVTYIFVRHDPRSSVTEKDLAQRLAELPQVYEVHVITGNWDILLKVRSEDMAELSDLILRELRSIEGVERTFSSTVLATLKEEA